VVFLGGTIVDFGGLDFIFVVAKKGGFAIAGDLGAPSLFIGVPGDALVF